MLILLRARSPWWIVGLLVACGGELPQPPQVPDPESEVLPHIEWTELAALPVPRANNAVAAIEDTTGITLFSFLGIGPGKDHSAVARYAYVLGPGENATWLVTTPPTHPRGRLASIAVNAGGNIYVFGGYTVDPDGHEVSVSDVDQFIAASASYSARAPMPIPVDDAVGGVWRDRYIVLVSGWSNTDNVADVQLYDTQEDSWSQGTPIIGAPVFGHGGAVAGDTIVYCGGAAVDQTKSPPYFLQEDCFAGTLDGDNIGSIDWRTIPRHPGPARYRMACGAVSELVVCAGGTENPYNYNGIGYDNEPSQPLAGVVAYDTRTAAWHELGDAPVATMDHRSLATVGKDLFLVGGMEAGQQVTARSWRLRLAP
jgi:N-acetylneuraminic acid mutarotase